eukprot:m.338071 g.338071  ORF g.338071 m.338071 type:complete len:69 (+) comp16533_c6_seq3:26-232(+)
MARNQSEIFPLRSATKDCTTLEKEGRFSGLVSQDCSTSAWNPFGASSHAFGNCGRTPAFTSSVNRSEN